MGARRRPAAVIVVVGCLMLGGCQFSFDTLTASTDAELLEAVSLHERDAAQGAVFQPYEGADEVQGRTSLDLCYGDFPSEDLRVGRRQVGIGDEAGTVWTSSEAILYSTPEEAQQAMTELEAARAECPDTAVTPAAGDGEPVVWSFEDSPDGDWPDEPGVARQAYAFTVTSADGKSLQSTATYLQRGRMILALYCSPPDSPATSIRNSPTPERFTEVMGNRLAAVPEEPLLEPNPVTPTEDPNDISA